jgi:hypothetical protein
MPIYLVSDVVGLISLLETLESLAENWGSETVGHFLQTNGMPLLGAEKPQEYSLTMKRVVVYRTVQSV